MFSDLYYLSKLIDLSTSFTRVEKQIIFDNIKDNPDKIKQVIKSFEDEQKGMLYIKSSYKKDISRIWRKYYWDLLKQMNISEVKSRNDSKIKINNIRKEEENEKKSQDLDKLINNI